MGIRDYHQSIPKDPGNKPPNEKPQRTIGPIVNREFLRLRAQGRKVLMRLRLGKTWDKAGDGMSGRVYQDYETYRAHQALKLDAHREESIKRHDRRFYSALRERLTEDPAGFAGRRVLCLAARQGTEVRAFIDEGAFAVGIDLNPGRDNRYVMVGDFHDLQFADGTVDVVFTNSLDHAFDLARILTGVKRVLTPDGVLICEVGLGSDTGAGPGFYESLSWAKVDDILDSILSHGFTLDRRRRFESPWPGEQLVLRKT